MATENAVFIETGRTRSRSQADDSPIKDKVGAMALPGGGQTVK